MGTLAVLRPYYVILGIATSNRFANHYIESSWRILEELPVNSIFRPALTPAEVLWRINKGACLSSAKQPAQHVVAVL